MLLSRKIRRQPICGAPGVVKFWFSGVTRRFEPAEGSYQAFVKKAKREPKPPKTNHLKLVED